MILLTFHLLVVLILLNGNKNTTQSSGITTNIPINDHSVVWRHSIKTQCELVISKQHLLMPCELKLEIYQEIGGSNLKQIGSLLLNISEYATIGPSTRRYLLEECKFNSFIKLSIEMKQLSKTDESFTAPPLTKSTRQSDISTMISNTVPEKKKNDGTNGSLSDCSIKSSNGIFKSQSALSLSQYNRNNQPFFVDEDPSPSALVEQLFTSQPDVKTTS
ncbi:unnamed protein product [Cunninghamella blakesleeana]